MNTAFVSGEIEGKTVTFRLQQDPHWHVTAVEVDEHEQPALLTRQELGIWVDINSAVVREVIAAQLGLFDE